MQLFLLKALKKMHMLFQSTFNLFFFFPDTYLKIIMVFTEDIFEDVVLGGVEWGLLGQTNSPGNE